jgi:hypothetical protein
MVARNEAIDKGVARLRGQGTERGKEKAKARHAEIAMQLREQKGRIKAVAIDRQGSGKPSSSERTIRRVKGGSKR